MPHPVPIPGSVKGRLIEAGIAQFERHGYEHTSVLDLARDAGVTTGALYHHFGSKLGLYEVIREEMERRMTDRMEGAAAALGGGRAGVRAALLVTFDAAVRFGATRILAEPRPDAAPDPVAATVERLIESNPVAARCVVAAWRGALMAVADGIDPGVARSGIAWVMAMPEEQADEAGGGPAS